MDERHKTHQQQQPGMKPVKDMPIGKDLRGQKLIDSDGNLYGIITEEVAPLMACSEHPDCFGPVVRIRKPDGRVRKECIYVLIRFNGFKLNN